MNCKAKMNIPKGLKDISTLPSTIQERICKYLKLPEDVNKTLDLNKYFNGRPDTSDFPVTTTILVFALDCNINFEKLFPLIRIKEIKSSYSSFKKIELEDKEDIDSIVSINVSGNIRGLNMSKKSKKVSKTNSKPGFFRNHANIVKAYSAWVTTTVYNIGDLITF